MSHAIVSGMQTDGDRARTVVGTFVLHLRPVRVPKAAIRFTHTFGLGGMSLVLLGTLALTGSLLMLGYTPVPGEAYASIERLEAEVLFGAFIRPSIIGARTCSSSSPGSTCCASSSPEAFSTGAPSTGWSGSCCSL
jgi:hypothetical protein